MKRSHIIVLSICLLCASFAISVNAQETPQPASVDNSKMNMPDQNMNASSSS